jgi:hypothetical protein
MTIISQIGRLLTDRQLCMRCLSLAVNLEEDTAQTALEALAASVLIVEAWALCRWCKTTKKTFTMPLR